MPLCLVCCGCWRGARVIPAGSSVWWTLLGRYRFGRGLHPAPTQQQPGLWVRTVKREGASCHSLAAQICSYTHRVAAAPKKSWKSDFVQPVHCLDWTTFNARLEISRGHKKCNVIHRSRENMLILLCQIYQCSITHQRRMYHRGAISGWMDLQVG